MRVKHHDHGYPSALMGGELWRYSKPQLRF